MHKITNIYKKSTIIPNRTCNLFICDCKTQENIHIKEDENSNVKWLEISKLEDYISLNDIEMLPIYKKLLNLK